MLISDAIFEITFYLGQLNLIRATWTGTVYHVHYSPLYSLTHLDHATVNIPDSCPLQEAYGNISQKFLTTWVQVL